MVLVDTSVWIRFLTGKAPFTNGLDALLDRGEVLAHDVVEGELLIGDRGGRPALLSSYAHLPRLSMLSHREVTVFVRARRLQGRGVGWLDAHLLASALVERVTLWTADANLASLARELKVEYRAAD